MLLKLLLGDAVDELLYFLNSEAAGLGLRRRNHHWFRNRLRNNYRLGNRLRNSLWSCDCFFDKLFRLRVELVLRVEFNFNLYAVFLFEV